jgi:large subunit ribosomal protein L19
MADLLASVETGLLKQNVPALAPGDTVRVHAKVVEGNRERIQVFEGVVMRLRKGGSKTDFTVRRISHGVGVERTFLVHSPRVDKIEVMRHGHVRRAQLYYLRGRVGRAARIRERRLAVKSAVVVAPTDVAEQTQDTATTQE